MGCHDHPGASALERARIAVGMTTLDVAHRLRVNPQTVTRWERRTHSPTRDRWLELSRLYGVAPANLLG